MSNPRDSKESLAIRWNPQSLSLSILDQTLLPHEEAWIEIKNAAHMIVEIKRLSIRGAPLIGVGAAFALAQAAMKMEGENAWSALRIREVGASLRAARPTAVNLMNAIDRCLGFSDRELTARKIASEAQKIYIEDILLCDQLAERGAQKIVSGMRILTHCNTGGLATAGVGTALGGIRRAHESGKRIHVYVDETRPLLQGARLTAWELQKLKIPYTLITDSMAGTLMAQKKIDLVMVGADRIAENGDFANKIGTYSIAVLARHHQIPFYVFAPRTTFDPKCKSGSEMVIEERDPEEVRAGKAPGSAHVFNPAFDVTPRSLVTSVVFEDGEI